MAPVGDYATGVAVRPGGHGTPMAPFPSNQMGSRQELYEDLTARVHEAPGS